MEIDYQALFRVFLAESEEGLAAMEDALIALESEPGDTARLSEIFRVVHTLKGDSASLGLRPLAELAHRVEDLLERLRDGRLGADESVVTLLLRTVDAFRRMLAVAEDGDDRPLPDHESLFRQIVAASSGEPPPLAPGEEASPAGAAPGVGWSGPADTLRVATEKLDRLLNLSGEIGVARGRLTRALDDARVSRQAILELHHEADRLFTDLQEIATQLRMVPVGPVFRRFVRNVRDLAVTHGKQARLAVEGADVEVDTRLIEQLRDPLAHMIRNAIDHGIEPAEARVAQGKAPVGRITLRARHEGSSIVIEVTDDGAGLDRGRILERARALGLVEADRAADDEAIARLILEPAVTTRDTVTDLSGRGVGLDVVRRKVEALRGSIGVTSRPGEGTAFVLRMPLTLATIEGFHLGLGDETYVVPLEAVVESAELPARERRRSSGTGVLALRGESVPYVRLRELLTVPGAPPARESVVIVRHQGDRRAGLVVDRLLGRGQTVIKRLAGVLQGPGVSGSTILDNGQVALILDVAALLREHSASAAPSVG